MAPRIAIALASLLTLGSHLISVNAQCLNNIAAYNPSLRSQTTNGTWFIVPVARSIAQAVVNEAFGAQNYTLLSLPTNDTTLFPNGFPAGMHPILAEIAFTADTRMSVLQIDGALRDASIMVPYVSDNSSGPALSASISGYIAGPNGESIAGLVPALVSTVVEGVALRLGSFNPPGAAYMIDNGGTYSTEAKWDVLPNPLTGPGVYPEVVDFLYHQIAASSSKYTDKTFKTMINQPIILSNGLCQRNAYYFTNATALPFFGNGQVTFGPGADGAGLLSSVLQTAGPVFTDVDSYAGCAQQLGNNPQDCATAAAEVDPASLQ